MEVLERYCKQGETVGDWMLGGRELDQVFSIFTVLCLWEDSSQHHAKLLKLRQKPTSLH